MASPRAVWQADSSDDEFYDAEEDFCSPASDAALAEHEAPAAGTYRYSRWSVAKYVGWLTTSPQRRSATLRPTHPQRIEARRRP